MAKDRAERKLTTILAADVVGYSRLMATDETGTLNSLKALRSEVFEPKLVIMGDNIESLGWASWLLLLVGGIALWLAVRRQMQARLGLTRADDED